MTKITCLGIDGNSEDFEVEVEENKDEKKWDFHVRTDKSDDFFLLTLDAVDDDTVQITEITHNNDSAYIGKGIPYVLLPYASNLLKKHIISSSHKYPSKEDEWRSIDANQMWDRFVEKGMAVYDIKKDIYILNKS